MSNDAKIFKALGDETRLRIIKYLLSGEKCACKIVPFTNRSQPTVSLQLAKLKRMGILSSRREGKKIYYKISDNRVRKLVAVAS